MKSFLRFLEANNGEAGVSIDADFVYRGKSEITSIWINIYDPTKEEQFFGSPNDSRGVADKFCKTTDRIAVLRIDTVDGVSKAHLEL